MSKLEELIDAVFPTHVGVDRERLFRQYLILRFPHARGGVDRRWRMILLARASMLSCGTTSARLMVR